MFFPAKANASDVGTSAAANYAPQTLPDAATLVYDTTLGDNAKITLTQSVTLAIPTNTVEGQSGTLVITQAAGGYAVALAAGYTSVNGNADITGLAASSVVQYSWLATAAGFDLFITQFAV